MRTYICLFFILLLFSCKKDTASPEKPIATPNAFGVINDQFEGVPIVVYGHQGTGVFLAFNRTLENGEILEMTYTPSFPDIMQDQFGNSWSVFGTASTGPNQGEQLKRVGHMKGFWFALSAFYPTVTLYQDNIENPRTDLSDPVPDWLINPSQIFAGGFKDGIPSIQNPKFITLDRKANIDDDFYLEEEDEVVVLKEGNNLKIYPIKVLNWHEIINDEHNGTPIAVSYCPLTHTVSIFESDAALSKSDFGVSGLLHNSNLVLYDRATESLWVQILGKSINGQRIEESLTTLPHFTTNWQFIRSLGEEYTIALLDASSIPVERDYDFYPYGDYFENHKRINYPISFHDKRLQYKEIVLAVTVNDKAKIYQYQDLLK